MITAKQQIHLHNRFDLQLIDSITGKIKQTAQAENVVLDAFWNKATNLHIMLLGVGLGTGSGTPSSTDNGLFKSAFASDQYTEYNRIKLEHKLPTSTLIGSFTFPASSSYVGTLTEICTVGGISYRSGYFPITHAMLVDSEGNPISIEKTDLDILVVTVTLYLTISVTDPNFILTPALYLWTAFTDRNSSGTPFTDGDLELYTCATDHGVGGAIQPGNSKRTWTADTRTLSIIGKRLGTGSGNTNYFNGIGIKGHGWLRLPNASVFSPYTISNIDIGTGDGTTTDFDCPLPMFIKDSDVLYKNGVALTRGVDYTIDNMQNKDALPCISAFNFAEYTEPSPIPDGWGMSGSKKIIGAFSMIEKEVEGRYLPKEAYVIHLKNPDPLIGNKINSIMFDNWNLIFQDDSSMSRYTYGTMTLVFEYSIDGEVWMPLTTVTATLPYNQNKFSTIDHFETVNANYIRVSTDADNTSLRTNNSSELPYPWKGVHNNLNRIKALYIGQPIHFTTAPAEGDVLTMDARIDRPFKNENFVLDTSMSITFA